jgi:hypothetical protein
MVAPQRFSRNPNGEDDMIVVRRDRVDIRLQ